MCVYIFEELTVIRLDFSHSSNWETGHCMLSRFAYNIMKTLYIKKKMWISLLGLPRPTAIAPGTIAPGVVNMGSS